MNLKPILLACLLSTAALSLLAPQAGARPQAWACTDIPYDDSCPSTLCVSLTAPTGFCTTRDVCVVGETRCIGNLACVELSVGPVCVPDPCYTTACTRATGAGTDVGPYCYLEIVGPDFVSRSCIDPSDPDCLLYNERWGKEGESMGKTCTLP